MRILVATTWFPTAGHPALGAFVARDVAALAAHHEVRVLHLVAPGFAGEGVAGGAFGPGRTADDGGTRVLDFPGIDPAEVRVRQLVTDLRRPDHLVRAGRVVTVAARGADVLHTAVFSTLLPLATRRVPVPWVHTEHWHGVSSTAGDSLALRLATPPLRALLRGPDVVTAVSELATAPIRELRRGRPTAVVPCIVAPPADLAALATPHDELRPGPAGATNGSSAVAGRTLRSAADAAHAQGRAGRPLRLVAVGGLIAGKDPVLAVETLAALRDRGRDAELTWVGDGPLRGAVAARAAELEVTVHLRGAVEPGDVAGELAAADLFLLPTRRETFGVAIAEAISHGLPVVVGADGGFREFVDDRVGAFVASRDPREWAEAVEQTLARTDHLGAAQIAATLGDRFAPETVVAGYESAYAQAGAPMSGAPLSDAEPLVDVIISVHSVRRPVARAVRSVLANRTPVRITVVCHGLPATDIAPLLGALPAEALAVGHEVRLVEFADGVASPAGPYNRGLDLATAPYVAVLGSDDRLAAGAIDSWAALARETDADAVITRLAYARPDGSVRAVVPTPPARPFRSRDLDPVRDRLAYRSAPLGLLRRATLERLGLRHDEGKPVGVDLELSTHLWFSGGRIAYDRRGPAYLIGEDGSDRITFAARPLERDLLWLPDLLDARWFRALPLTHRRAIAAKILRIHVFGAIHYRAEPDAWTPEERTALRSLTTAVLAAAPDAERMLSRAEHDLLDVALDPDAPAERLIALSARRRRHGRPETLVPRDLRCALAREAPLRLMAASVLVRGLRPR